jgi:CBS domain-containing protein
MPTAKDVLGHKGFSIHVMPPSATVWEAVQRMNQLRVGAIIIMDEGQIRGMFTERDVLRRVVGEQRDPMNTQVADVMTEKVIYCSPQTDIDEVSSIMRDRRIRHLPVCDTEGDILGLISIGDVNAVHASNQEMTISYLNEYIYGRA